MKISFDIDCTAEEARKFFGLPEVQPLQEALMKEVQERMSANIKAMDAEDDDRDLAAGDPQRL